MKRLLPIALVTVIAACGGDDLPVAGTPAPSQGTASPAAVKIDGANYLDAFAIGAVAVSRVIDAAHIVGIVNDGSSRLDPPGAQNCWANGSLEWNDMLLDEHTRVVRPCASGSVELRSGYFSDTLDGIMLTDVVWRRSPDPMDLKMGGSIRFNRNTDGSATLSGAFSAQREGADATYIQVSAIAVPATGGNAARVTAGSLQVRAAPFAPHLLAVAVSEAGTKVSVTAPDGSHVDASDAASGTTSARKFEVFDADGPMPVVTQTLSMDDPLVVAAIARAQD